MNAIKKLGGKIHCIMYLRFFTLLNKMEKNMFNAVQEGNDKSIPLFVWIETIPNQVVFQVAAVLSHLVFQDPHQADA